jgi:membrane protein DedA with SNARE-associated domain
MFMLNPEYYLASSNFRLRPQETCMTPIHLHWIKTYGYLGVFSSLMLGIFGLPLPDETILAFVGFLVFKGYFHPLPCILTAFLGSICGITMSYLVGRTLGLPLLEKYRKYLHITPEKLAKAHEWFEKYGKWSLFGGYFLPGVRHLTALSAGVSGLEYRQFALYAYSGGLLFVVTFLTLGYVVGDEWRKVIPQVHSYLWMLAAAVIGLGLAACLVHIIRRSARQAPHGGRD